MSKILRMFRTCGENRVPPLGTLSIIQRDDKTVLIINVSDKGERSEVGFDGFGVEEVPTASEENAAPTGRVFGMRDTAEGGSWFIWKELPVSAQTIRQSVISTHLSPIVSPPKKA